MILQVTQRGEVVHSLRVGARSLTIGRAADNDLILRSDQVSGHHAVILRDGGRVLVRDLGSTNGVFHNGERVAEAPLTAGDVIRLGDIELRCVEAPRPAPTHLQIEQVDGPVAWTVQSGFPLPGVATAMFYTEREHLLLERDGHVQTLHVGDAFTLQGVRYRVTAAPLLAETEPADSSLPYTLAVDLDHDRAQLQAPHLRPVVYTASARVSLLFVLGQQNGTWIEDAEVGSAVWGRAWTKQDPNNLNVLVYRVRSQAADGGFDRRFIERRRGALRLVVATTQMQAPAPG